MRRPNDSVHRHGRVVSLAAAAALAAAAWLAGAGPAPRPASETLAVCQAAIEDELFETAEASLTRLMADPLAPDARRTAVLLLAQARHGLDRGAAVRDLLLQSRDLFAGSDQEDAFAFWLATAYARAGQWADALEPCRRLERLHPASPHLAPALRLGAQALLRLGRPDEANAWFARAAALLDATDDGPANRLDWAGGLFAANRIADARRVLSALPPPSAETPSGQDTLRLMGRLALAEGDANGARAAFLPLANGTSVPDDARAAALIALADLADARSNRLEAIALLDQGLARLAEPLPAGLCRLRKGKLLIGINKLDEGIALVRGFVAQHTGHQAARAAQLDLAQSLLDRGAPDKALTDFQYYLETFGDPAGIARAQEGKGTALFRLGRPSEAAAAFERAADLAAAPADQARARLNAGQALMAAGQYKAAIERFAGVSARWPESVVATEADFQAAACRALLGDADGAETRFWELADRDPTDPMAAAALLRIADLMLRRQQWQQAGALFRQISQAYPDPARAEAWLGLGLLAYRTGQFAEALDHVLRVRDAAAPPATTAHAAYLAPWCRFRLGDELSAADGFRAFADGYPESPWAPDACFWLAETDFNHGRRAAAETGFLDLAHRYAGSRLADSALFWAGRAALLQHEFERANRHFARLVKDYPASRRRPEARFFQAAALAELGDFASAILIYDEIVKQAPDAPLARDARLRMGDCQFTLAGGDPGRYEDALRSYRTVLEAPDATPAARLEAAYKIGRCLERTGRSAAALERYLAGVYQFWKTPAPGPAEILWFTRAAFQGAAIEEAATRWRQAAHLYQRVADADVPASPEARERIARLRQGHRLLSH